MVLFPISGVLRGFMPSTYYQYASGINPCAAVLIEKIPHFLIKKRRRIKPNSINLEPISIYSVRKLKG